MKKTESLLEEFSLTAIRKNRGDLLSGRATSHRGARALADPKFLLLMSPLLVLIQWQLRTSKNCSSLEE